MFTDSICSGLWTRSIQRNKNASQKIAIEMEFFAFDAKTFAPYGVPPCAWNPQRVLQALHEADDESELYQDDETGIHIGLRLKNGVHITIEPGGQIEFSSTPCEKIEDVEKELHLSFKLLEKVTKGELVFLSHGTHPTAPKDFPILLPKKRYQILERYFKSQPNGRGTEMMRFTTTVQPNIDLPSDSDWEDAVNLTFALTPFVRHMFAHSFFLNGSKSQFISERQEIWAHIDSSRTGIPNDILFASNISCAYAEWAKHANVFLAGNRALEEQPKYGELTFLQWMQKGYHGTPPTIKNWEDHLSTLFPDLRIRSFLEVRSVDSQPFDQSLMPLVFFATLLQQPIARERAWLLFCKITKQVISHDKICRRTEDGKKALQTLLTYDRNHEIFKDESIHKQFLQIVYDTNEMLGRERELVLINRFSEWQRNKKEIASLSPQSYVEKWSTAKPSECFLVNGPLTRTPNR